MRGAAFVVGVCAAAAPAWAQTPHQPQPAEPASPRARETAGAVAAPLQNSGLIVYPPAFFASARPNTAFDMIQRLPGFSFQGGENVRGFAGAGGNVLIDGRRPASKNEALQDILSRIPASQVSRVELIRGGAPGIDMQGQTVVANVVRNTAASFQSAVTSSLNLIEDGRALPELRAEFGRQAGDRGWEAQLGRFSIFSDGAADGARNRYGPDRVIREHAVVEGEGDGAGYDAKGSFRTPFLGGKLRVNGSGDTVSYREENEVRSATLLEDTDFNLDRINGEVGLNWDRKLGPRTEMQAILLQRLGGQTLLSTFTALPEKALFTADSTSGESIARASVRFARSAGWSYEWGGEGAFNFLDSATTFVLNGAPVALPSGTVRVEERRAEGFAQTTWRPRVGLTVEAGSRFEVSAIRQEGDVKKERSFFYPKPRAVVIWSPNPATQVRVRVQREVSQLAFGDFVASAELQNRVINAGNPELEPAKTWVFETVLERRFWTKGAAVLSLRHNSIDDVIDLVPITGPGFAFDAPGNIGEGVSDEAELSLTLPLDRLRVPNGLLKSSIKLRTSQVTDPTTGESRRISRQRPHETSITFTQDLTRWRTTWGFDASLGFEEEAYRISEVRRLEFGPSASLFMEYKPSPRLSVRGELNPVAFRLDQERTIYSGTRAGGSVLLIEEREAEADRRFNIRVRRTFN